MRQGRKQRTPKQSNNLNEILQDFEIYGQSSGEWQTFEKGVEYEAFLIRRRS